MKRFYDLPPVVQAEQLARVTGECQRTFAKRIGRSLATMVKHGMQQPKTYVRRHFYFLATNDLAVKVIARKHGVFSEYCDLVVSEMRRKLME